MTTSETKHSLSERFKCVSVNPDNKSISPVDMLDLLDHYFDSNWQLCSVALANDRILIFYESKIPCP